jgi:hypothetical protein
MLHLQLGQASRPTESRKHLLIDYAYCYYTVQKCASSLPAWPSMTTHRKRRSPSDPLSAKGEPDAQKDLAENAFRDREEIAQHSRNLHAKMCPNQETKKRGSRPLCMGRFDDLFCGDWEVSTFVSRMMIDQCRKRSNAQCL